LNPFAPYSAFVSFTVFSNSNLKKSDRICPKILLNLFIYTSGLGFIFIKAILAASSKIEPHDIECHALSVNQNKNEENFVNYANYENSKELI